ncbi:MAG: succinate dehydrogenase cytochrome b subunit [Acidimicrobiia bacterium]
MTTTKRPAVHGRHKWQDWLGGFFSSSIGLKWLMALTGIGLLLYVFAHLVGNLKVFLGANALGEYEIDLYGEALRNLGGDLVPHGSILWLMRLGLIAAFVIHIGASAILTRRNWEARGWDRYDHQRSYAAANYASRTMRWGGIIILLFVLFHIADLTLGWTNPEFEHGEVYHNIVTSLTRTPVAILYLVAQFALAFHIYHGGWSLFQSLGWANPKYNGWRRGFAAGFAALIFIGNVAIVLAVWSGAVSMS